LQGIRKYADHVIRIEYEKGCNMSMDEEGSMDGKTNREEEHIRKAVNLASKLDLTILVLGGSSSRFGATSFATNGAVNSDGKVSMDCGEGVDSATLTLPGRQNELAAAIFRTGKPVITILIQGRPYAVPEITDKSQALLCAFYPGMMGGQAIAEILFGKIAPSGRLPVSIPRHVGQLPVYYNYKSSYVGMNYYDIKKTPLYPFGYGLTYSKLTYEDFVLSHSVISIGELEDSDITLSFRIKNEGSYQTYGVPQLYIRDLQASTVRRIRELKAFTKVNIPAGESREVILNVGRDELAIWDIDMNFCVEKGDVEFYLCDMGIEFWSGKVKLI
jgi:beta-glucosidase